jgi:hypothetical protein
MIHKISTIKLIMKYIFIINLVGDINVNIIRYNLVKVKLFDLNKSYSCIILLQRYIIFQMYKLYM